MSLIATQGKFHVALDGVGLLLQGAPGAPAYRVSNAPVYGTRFASGDRDYNDLSQWWYLIQTDWSGGLKDTVSFLDDAKYYYSSNIDARTKPGTIQLEKQLTLVWDNTSISESIHDVKSMTILGGSHTHFIDSSNIRTTGGTSAFDSAGNPTGQLAHRNYMWLFGTKIANSNTALPYPYITSDKTSYVNTVITGSIDTLGDIQGCSVGNDLYIVGINDEGSVWVVKTAVANPGSSSDFTLVAEFPLNNSLGASVVGVEHLGGELLILVEGSPVWTLSSLDIATGIVTEVKKFENSVQNGIFTGGGKYLKRFFTEVLVTVQTGGNTNEDGEIWSYNGGSLTLLYECSDAKKAFSTREAKPYLVEGCTIYDNYAFWGNLVMDSEHNFYNFIKDINDNPLYTSIPVGQDGALLYLVSNEVVSGDSQSKLYSYNRNGTAFKDGANHEAFLILSLHDKLQSIDKLLNSLTLGFEKLLSGQEINLYYSTNPIPDPDITTGSWSLLGSATYAVDGASVTSKVLPFPVGTTAKKIWLRVELVSGGTNTPGLNDLTLEYLPVPDYKKEWTININCADELKDLAGSLVETTARELKSRLERMWWTKSALDFQDVDYATTLLNGSLNNSASTVTVDSTANFPEQGRLRVDDEDILYTGKTPTTFTGCTRGARGTRAATHSDNAVIHNAYRVIVMSVEEQTPILLEDKDLEYTVKMLLREV